MSPQVLDRGMRHPYCGQTPVLSTLLVLATNQPSQFAPSSWVLPLSTTASFPNWALQDLGPHTVLTVNLSTWAWQSWRDGRTKWGTEREGDG